MKNLNFLSNLCGLGRASQSSDVGYDSRSTVVRPSFDCRSTLLKLVTVLVLVLTIGVGNVWGATATFTASDQGWSGTSTKTQTVSGVTFSFAGGTTNPTYYAADGLRTYENCVITISSTNTITGIVFTYTINNNGYLKSFNTGTWTSGTKTWSGSATSINCTVGHSSGTKNGQVRITSIVVTYTPSAASHTLSSAVSPAASGTVDLSATSVAEGSTATATATPATHYVFDHWSISGTGSTLSSTTTNPTTVTMGTANTTVTATFTAVPKASITLSEAGATTTDATTYYVGDSYTLPSSTEASCGTKVLVGWSTVEVAETNTKPTSNFYEKGETVTLAASQTFYAVFATASGGAAPTAYTAGDEGTYVLAIYVSDTWYALPATPTVSSGKISGEEITVSNTGGVDYVTSANASGFEWTIANATSGQTISDGSYYIYHSNGGSSGTNLTYGTGTTYTWTIASETKGLTFKGTNGVTVNSRGLLASGTTFGGYALSNEDASGYYRIHVLPIGGGTTYSAYSTTCCEPLAQINGSFSFTNVSETAATANWNWDKATTGISKNILKVYDNSNDALVKTIDNIPASTTSYSIGGLTPCKTYYVKLTTVSSGSTYCEGVADQAGASKVTFTTNGWAVHYSSEDPEGALLSNITKLTGATTACTSENYVATFEAQTGYELPANITVWIASDEKREVEDYTWAISNGVGTLTIFTANLEEEIDVRIIGACVSPSISVSPQGATYAVDEEAAALTVTASAAGASLGYQWQSSSDNVNWSDIAEGNGGKAATYTPSTASAGTTTYYRVIVSNKAAGCATSTPSPAAAIVISSIPICEAPAFGVAAGTYNSVQTVSITSKTEGATIYYTMGENPADPTDSDTEYTGPISVTANTTIKAIAIKDGYTASNVQTATYVLQCVAPTFSPAAGAITSGQEITLSCATEGATIYYSTDGNDPTIDAQHLYDAENKPVVSSATTIKAVAVKTGWTNSTVASAAYTANYSIVWKVNGEALTGSALDGVTTNVLEGGSITNLPASPAGLDCAATFMGWSADEIGLTPLNNEDDAARIAALGLFKNAANAPAIAANTTFHAVFATAGEGGGTIYNLVSSATNFTDGTYVVAALDGETYYFMDGTSAAKGLGVETTGLAASSVSEGSFAVSSLPSGAIEIEVEDDGDPQEDNHYYYIYYISGDDTYFLDDEGTKQSITWTTNTEVYTYHPNFDHNNTTDGCVLLSGSTAKVSQNGSDKTTFVRNYASDGSYYNDLYFFKKTSLQAYNNYVTKCCKPWDNPTVAYGSYNLVAGGDHASVTITGTQHGTPEFTSSNTSVIEVNASTGEVTPVGAGTAHVIVTWPSANDYCEKTLNSSDFTVTGIVAITFKLNGGSVAGDAEKTQEVTTGEDVALTSLATLGYVAPACKEFGGWAASEEDANAATPVVFKADGATINVSEATNLWAIWNTKTFAVIDGTIDASVASHSFSSTVACGSDLTITCAAAAAYKGNPTVTATGTHGEITVNSATSVTIANVQSAIAVSIAYETAKANYAITWKVNGSALEGAALDGVTTNVYEGDAIENLPSVADNAVGACANKFMGWSADEIGLTALDKDDDATRIAALGLFKDAAHAPAISTNTTFHAVFATLVSAESTSLTKMVTGDTFADGDRIVITANGLKIGLFQETVSSSYVNYWEFEGDDPTLADLDDDKKIWDVTEDENNKNKWNLGDETNGYLYNGTGSSNNAMSVSETEVSSWDLTDKEDGTFSLKALNPLSCRSDLTGDNKYKWRGGGAQGGSGTSALVIYKLTSTPDVYNNYVTECITVTYNANGGATTCTNDATVTTEDYIVCATEPTRDYYTFAGWLCSADAERYAAGATIDEAVINGNFTLTAQWTPTNYSITYNLNGGTQQETPAPATSYTIESSTITLPTPSYGHKRFDGWFDNKNLEGDPKTNIAAGSTGDVELWAKWSERYTVQFYAEDELTTIYRAADEKLNASVAGQGSAPANPSAPALCNSKTFVGWSESAITLETDVVPVDLRTTDSEVDTDKTFYAVWATDNGDETYSAYSTYCYNAFVPDGGAGKGNWSNAENWSSGSAPDENTRVVIDSKEMTVDVTNAQAKEIVVKNEGKLIVAPGKAIIVAGKITKDNGKPTTAADLKVESSAAGNGTLIFENDDNAATVEMYSIGSTDGWKWQYIGVPFDGANAQATYYGAYLYKWNNGWTAVQKSDDLEMFAGYCISYPAANYTYVMDGALAPTEEQSITVPAGKSKVVGNSWTAPIQITQFEDEDFSGLLKNVYLYNTGNDSTGEASTTNTPTGGAIYAAGTYISVPIHSAEYTDVKVISSLQGFFVKNNSGSAGTLSLSYSKHVRPSGGNSVVNGAMHAPKRVADETDRPAVLKMKVSGSQYDDRLILLEREDFTTGYDAGWDGDKMGDVATSPRITTTREDGTADAVAALPDLEGTLINFRAASTDDQYTLYFDYETEDAEPLYLLDLTNNAYTRVETGGSYTFVTTDKADHKRFALTRYRAPQITTGVEDTSEDNGQGKAVKFIENDKLYILRNGVLYDGTGKKVIEN